MISAATNTTPKPAISCRNWFPNAKAPLEGDEYCEIRFSELNPNAATKTPYSNSLHPVRRPSFFKKRVLRNPSGEGGVSGGVAGEFMDGSVSINLLADSFMDA